MKNSLRLLIAATVIGGTIAGTAAFALQNQPQTINPSFANEPVERCGAIHFGPELQAINYTEGTATGTGKDGTTGIKSLDNYPITGAGYKHKDGYLRLASKNSSGSIAITLPTVKEYVTIWASGYNKKSSAFTVGENYVVMLNNTPQNGEGTFNSYKININSDSFSISVAKNEQCFIAGITYVN